MLNIINRTPEEIKEDRKKNLVVWVYSEPMGGKTTFIDTFPKVLLFSTDKNYKSFKGDIVDVLLQWSDDNGETRKDTKGQPINFDKTTNAWLWTNFLYYMEDLIKNLDAFKTKYESIAIDVLDMTLNWYMDFYKKEKGILNIKPFEDYQNITRNWLKFIEPILNAIKNKGFNLVWSSHAKLKKVDEDEKMYPALLNGNENILKEINKLVSSFTCRIKSKKIDGVIKKILVITESEYEFAGNRYGYKGKTVEPTYEALINAIKESE